MNVEQAFLSSLNKAAKTTAVIAVSLIVLGILSIVLPSYSGMTITVLIGIMFTLGGFLKLGFSFATTSWGSAILRFLFGLILIVGGLWLVFNPTMGLQAMTIILAIIFIIDGVFEIIFSFALKPVGGGATMLIVGIIGIILGILIWMKWPSSAEWAIGLLVGIKLIVDGIALYSLSVLGKKASETQS